jgi:hypothetical protein
MNTPFNSHAWRHLRQHAAAQLSPQFADNVLRAARIDAADTRWTSSPFFVSAATAALCLLSVMLFHVRATNAASEQHLADWAEISVQTASIDPNP